MADKIQWYGCERVLNTIEDAVQEFGSNYIKRCNIYDNTVNIHRPWYWLQPNEWEFAEVMDAAGALFHCGAIKWYHPNHILIKSRADKRELLDAEKVFVQALHFNKHVRPHHVCQLTYRDACYFGVDAVWCESKSISSDEIGGSNKRSEYANMSGDALLYLRELFADH